MIINGVMKKFMNNTTKKKIAKRNKKSKTYKKGVNILRNNIADKDKKDYESTRKSGIVRVRNTRKQKKDRQKKTSFLNNDKK